MRSAPVGVYVKMVKSSFSLLSRLPKNDMKSSSSSLPSLESSQQKRLSVGRKKNRVSSLASSASAPDLKNLSSKATPRSSFSASSFSSSPEQTEDETPPLPQTARVHRPSRLAVTTSGVEIHTKTASQVFVNEVFNPLGLFGFTCLLLDHSAREIGQALRVLIDERNYPVVIHCVSGTPSQPFWRTHFS